MLTQTTKALLLSVQFQENVQELLAMDEKVLNCTLCLTVPFTVKGFPFHSTYPLDNHHKE